MSAIHRAKPETGHRPNDHLEAALASVQDGVITTDIFDRITYMNPAAELLCGWQLRQAAGEVLTHVFSIADSPLDARGDTGRSIDGGARCWKRGVLVTATRRAVVIDYSVTPIRSDEAAASGTVTVIRNMTDQRATEVALRSSEETVLASAEALFEEKERAQVTLNSIGDAVISTDFRGRVSFLNVIAEKMTGWTQAEATGRQLEEIFPLVDSTTREPVASPTMQAIIENKTVGMESPSVFIRRDGTEIAVEDSASPIHDKRGGVIGAVMVAHDATIAREQTAKLARLALYDTLTGLPNRTLLNDRLEQSLAREHRHGIPLAVLFIDLDQFKPVNDSLGHATGDLLLQLVAQRLITCVRSSDTVSRYGGDEFIIMLADLADARDAALCANKVIAALNAPFEVGPHRICIGASIGIATSDDTIDPLMLIKYADIAMYAAKALGRNNYKRFCCATDL